VILPAPGRSVFYLYYSGGRVIWILGNFVRAFCGRVMGVALRGFGSMAAVGYVAGICFFQKDMQSIYLRSNNSPERRRDCLI